MIRGTPSLELPRLTHIGKGREHNMIGPAPFPHTTIGDPTFPYPNPEPPHITTPLPDWQYALYSNHGFPPGYTGGWDPHGPPGPIGYDWTPRDPESRNEE